jgi:hypothetical protein
MAALPDFLDQIGRWFDRAETRAAREDEALRALLTAVNSTKRYLGSRTQGGPPSTRTQARLVRLWTEAAVRVRRFDRELAHRLQLTAEYWAHPERWTARDMRTARIRIEEIAASARSLLRRGVHTGRRLPRGQT